MSSISMLKEYIGNINESIKKLKKLKKKYKEKILSLDPYRNVIDFVASPSNPDWFPEWVTMTDQEKRVYLDRELEQITKKEY